MVETLCRMQPTPDTDSLGTVRTMNAQGDAWAMEVDATRVGIGQGQILTFADADCVTSVVDLRLNRVLHSKTEALEDLLLIRANVGSACSYTVPGGTNWRFIRPAVTVSFLPRGSQLSIAIESGTAMTAVTLLLRPRALLERFGLRREDLPGPLLSVIDRALVAPENLISLPLEADVASLVEDLVRSRLAPSLRSLQVSARVIELLLLVVASWRTRLSSGTFPGLRSRDAELVTAARRILTERMAAPPTLKELALELGTNRNKLNQIFQRGMGVTLKAFCVQRRIERAQALLHEGRLNVAQIAETVGYQHQSSFAAAFRDVVGMCPREYGVARQPPPESELAMH